jgi:photosystem II stability/assembly factor-like uncharacterized protein
MFKFFLSTFLITSFAWSAPLAAVSPNAAISSVQANVTSKWIPTNPGGGGAFSNVGAGPTGIIVAASDLSGVYVSADNGAHWRNAGATQGILTTHASSVGFDTQDGNIIYVGTEAGLYRSADGANTFSSVLSLGFVSAVQMSSVDVNRGYAARNSAWNSADGQIYRSTNRGLTWQKVSTNLPATIYILKILISPFDANVLFIVSGQARFASGPQYVYRSTDGGVTWQRIATSITSGIMDVASSPRRHFVDEFQQRLSHSHCGWCAQLGLGADLPAHLQIYQWRFNLGRCEHRANLDHRLARGMGSILADV